MTDDLLPPDSPAPSAADALAPPEPPRAEEIDAPAFATEPEPEPTAPLAEEPAEPVVAEAEPDDFEEPAVEEAAAEEPAAEEPAVEQPAAAPAPEQKKRWYVVKVQSGREDSIKDAIERRVKIEGLEEFYGQIHIPTEQVVEMRRGKRVKKERKLYPGYLMAEVEYNDRILYLFRETSGVGDFVGGTIHRAPPPMSKMEIDRMMGRKGEKIQDKVVPTRPEFEPGDPVKVKDGAFAGMEGVVKEILEAKGQVRVEVKSFDRPVSLEMEYWQVEQA